jgi:hypothetical protein
VAVKHPLSQRLQEVGLAVHHLRQLWWRRWRWCSSSKLPGGTRPQCGLLPSTEGSSPGSSTATAMTTGHGHRGKRAVVQTSRTAARHLTAGLGHYLTFFVRCIIKWFINLKRDYYPTLIQRCNKNHKMQ